MLGHVAPPSIDRHFSNRALTCWWVPAFWRTFIIWNIINIISDRSDNRPRAKSLQHNRVFWAISETKTQHRISINQNHKSNRCINQTPDILHYLTQQLASPHWSQHPLLELPCCSNSVHHCECTAIWLFMEWSCDRNRPITEEKGQWPWNKITCILLKLLDIIEMDFIYFIISFILLLLAYYLLYEGGKFWNYRRKSWKVCSLIYSFIPNVCLTFVLQRRSIQMVVSWCLLWPTWPTKKH